MPTIEQVAQRGTGQGRLEEMAMGREPAEPLFEELRLERPSPEELKEILLEDDTEELEIDLHDLRDTGRDPNIALYLNEACSLPIFTRKEERAAFQTLRKGQRAQARLEEGNLTPKEEEAAKTAVERGNLKREEIILRNTRLVVSIARRLAWLGILPFLDLIQEGNLGLMRAVEKFDLGRGYKFSTYATWWIWQAMSRALADQGRTIRLPVHLSDRVRNYTRVKRALEQQLNRRPSFEEVAAEMGLSKRQEETLKIVFLTVINPVELDAPVSVDKKDGKTRGDFEQGRGPRTEEEVSLTLLRETLEGVLADLAPREASILRMRFGLDGHGEHTLEECGRKFGVTRERIRQIEKKALGRLRHPSRSRKLRGYLP